MIAEGRTSVHQAWWVLVAPLITLFLTVLSFSQLGEGLKDRFDRCCDELPVHPQPVGPPEEGPPLLRRVSLDVAAGEVHGLVGESGAGKSMIGKAVLGILPPSVEVAEGEIVLNGWISCDCRSCSGGGGSGRWPRSSRRIR